MLYFPNPPYYKIYRQENNALHIVWFDEQGNTGHFTQNSVGDFLIQFLEMDLQLYLDKINEVTGGTDFEASLLLQYPFDELTPIAYDTANMLSGNTHLHAFMVSRLNKVFGNREYDTLGKLERAYTELRDVVALYNIFASGTQFCLDVDAYPEIPLGNKFVGLVKENPRYNKFAFHTGYGVAPTTDDGKLDYAAVKKLNDSNADMDKQMRVIHTNKPGVSLVQYTIVECFEELIFFDFLEVMAQGLSIRVCKLCGKLFVLKTKHPTEYCNRVFENGRTCKEMGPKRFFNEKLSKPENAVEREYQRIRRAKQAKMYRARDKETGKDIGKAETAFKTWSKAASALYERFKAGELGGDAFIKALSEVSC